jgi:hypothetical protein
MLYIGTSTCSPNTCYQFNIKIKIVKSAKFSVKTGLIYKMCVFMCHAFQLMIALPDFQEIKTLRSFKSLQPGPDNHIRGSCSHIIEDL